MPPRLTWNKLVPGLIALAAIVTITIGVLIFAGVGRVRGETVRVLVLTDQAHGLIPGSEVWVDGQKAGNVHHIGFRPPSADTLHRVVIGMDVRRDAAAQLRDDSRVRLRSGGTVIGPVVVFLESGTPDARPIREGDTLRTLGQSSAQVIMTRLGPATRELPQLMEDARSVAASARDDRGTVGAFLTRGLPRDEITELRRNVAAIQAMAGGKGESRWSVLAQRASGVMARADSVRALIGSSEAGLGRFRRDTSLLTRIGEIRDELSALQRLMDEGDGTLPRLRRDSALVRSISDARTEMARLFEDVRRRPLRYIHF